MHNEIERDRKRVADILVEALAMAEATNGDQVLVYLIKLSIMEADRDFHTREYFNRAPRMLETHPSGFSS